MHFQTDPNAFFQDGQYMWSNGLLFTPVLKQGATSVTGYCPQAKWYSMFDDSMIDTFAAGAFQTLETPLKATNVHARGGSVIPMQQFAMTTTAVRATPYTLLVALDGSQQAEGSLHVEDGVQLYLDSYATTTFSVKRDTIKATSEVVSYDNI
jgi:alpha-glucosidase (family GH31 glycosyl hydrolase)